MKNIIFSIKFIDMENKNIDIELYLTNILRMFGARKYTNIKSYIDEDHYNCHTVTATNKFGKKIMARIILDSKLHIGVVKECITVFTSNDISKGIIIHYGIPTSSGKNLIINLDKTDQIKISMMNLKTFSNCPLDHKYYFPHTKLKKEEVVEFKQYFDLSKIKIPIIFMSDPISKFFDFKSGDIIKIKRGDMISYRLVKNR